MFIPSLDQNNDNKHLYSALACITQRSIVTQNEWNIINERKELLDFEVKNYILY